MFQLMARGVPCLYYGEEIGMTDGRIPYKDGLDPIAKKNSSFPRILTDIAGETLNRDDVRTPMQWNDQRHAGFSNAQKTWLPLNGDYQTKNVSSQSTNPNSLLNVVKRLNDFRNNNSQIKSGSLALENAFCTKDLLCFQRTENGKDLWVILNFSKRKQRLPEEFRTRKLVFNLNALDAVSDKVYIAPHNGIIFE